MTDLPVALVLVPAAALALAYGLAHAGRGPSARASVVKTLSTALLVPAAALAGAPGGIVAGLALGALGDYCLSRPGQGAFLAGMAAFALGHLAYAAVLFDPAGLGAALWPGLGLLAFALTTELWLAPHTGALRLPVRGYVGVITLMGLAALTAGGAAPARLAGAALFILSDVLLALALFRTTDPVRRLRLGRLLWAAYWSGQALIGLGGLSPGV